MNRLQVADYAVFLVYFVVVSSYGIYIYHKKKAKSIDSKDFFLAEGSLTWWAIGASLIAFILVYFVVFGAGIFYMLRLVGRSPDGDDGELGKGPHRAAGITPVQEVQANRPEVANGN